VEDRSSARCLSALIFLLSHITHTHTCARAHALPHLNSTDIFNAFKIIFYCCYLVGKSLYKYTHMLASLACMGAWGVCMLGHTQNTADF